MYRARKRYEPGAKFSTWLFTIANNVAANALRSQSRRHEVNLANRGTNSSTSVPTLEQLAQAASGFMPARQFEKAEMRDVIRQAMATLNERQRMAVLLSKFESMSYEEIAETMQMLTQAIKSLLSRARGNLREILEPYLERGELKELGARGDGVGAIDEEFQNTRGLAHFRLASGGISDRRCPPKNVPDPLSPQPANFRCFP